MALNKMYRFTCAAPNCQMRTYDFTPEQSKLAESNYIVSFHKFPADEERRNAWIAAANRKDWKPDADSSICSLHFKDDCYNQNNQLFDHAIPTIFFENFRTCLKNIIKTMGMDVQLESAESDNEDILIKRLKNLSPVCSDIEEIIEIAVSDDEFDIECEEIVCDEENENQQANEEIPTLLKAKKTNTPLKTESAVQESTSVTESFKSVVDDLSKATPEQYKNSPARNNTTVKKTQLDVKTIKKKKLPSKPSMSSETVNKLHTLIQRGSFDVSPFMQPASRSLVYQLLNIVKLANAPNASQPGNSVANTYIITTKQENTDSNAKSKIRSMETSEIVSLITNTVQAVKDGVFQKTDFINIICASPAIFLIKNVVVNNFDRNMNSVYVITSENLVPHIIQSNMKTKARSDQPESLKIVSKPVQTTQTNVSASSIPNVSVSETRLVRPTSKMTVTTVMNPSKVSSIVATKTSATRPRIVPHIATSKTGVAPLAQLRMPSTPGLSSKTGTVPCTTMTVPVSKAMHSRQTIASSGLGIKTGTVLPVSTTATVYVTAANQVTATFKTGTLLSTNTAVPVSIATPKSSQTVAICSPKLAPSTFRSMTSKLVNVSKLQQSLKSAFQSPVTPSSTNNLLTSGVSVLPKLTTNCTPLIAVNVPSTDCTEPLVIHSAPNTLPSNLVSLKKTNTNSSQTSTSTMVTINAAKLNQTSNAWLVKKNPTIGIVSTAKLNQTVTLPVKMNATTKNANAGTPNVGTLFSPALTTVPQIMRNVTTAARLVHPPTSQTNFQPVKPSLNATIQNFPKAPKRILEIDLRSPSPPDRKKQAVDLVTPDPKNLTVDVVTLDLAKEAIDVRPNLKTQAVDFAIKKNQKSEILSLEKSIIKTEREINTLKRKILTLKKRYLVVRNPVDSKPDEQVVDDILKKYLESDAVQFLVAQMKVSGKTYTQFRWSEEDKLFALGLLYKNPSEYHLLGQKYDLPSDKTLSKFVTAIKRAEMDSKN